MKTIHTIGDSHADYGWRNIGSQPDFEIIKIAEIRLSTLIHG